MLTGFTFNRVVIIQSLEPSEVKTGLILSELIYNLASADESQMPVQIIECGYAGEFIQIVEKLTQEAKSGNVPLLHVECHGDPMAGLEFANGSTLPWEDVAQTLLPLNIASRFNLLSVFSACFGAHFLGQMGVIRPAPCWCLVAPTDTVDPGEILAGFRIFYSLLFETGDMSFAVEGISKYNLSNGRWLWEPAELWFEHLVTNYVEVHCNKLASLDRARKLHRQLKEQGVYQGIGSIRRKLRLTNRTHLLGKYFDTYFLTSEIPSNVQRFSGVKKRVSATLDDFRGTGRYEV